MRDVLYIIVALILIVFGVALLVKQILREKAINFEDRNTLMILMPCENKKCNPDLYLETKDYENKEIELDSSFFNLVEINLKEIKDTKLYFDILNEMRTRLRCMEKKFFSYAGLIYMVLGIFLLWVVMKSMILG
ncbi:hypothetical protein [Crassaminicella profunda]|uniref:hypothetical protein n=1 Tax=Crassaminicella profunda TaxID=1286698 RepID=UPI001CA76520|nr:hypothetical protein [Crassaminicella profunda]QZY54385.1 hypothetical protein K7H06_15250 [Crassaminicella profunda]